MSENQVWLSWYILPRVLWHCGWDNSWGCCHLKDWLEWWSTSRRFTPMTIGWRSHFLTSCFRNTCGPFYRSAPHCSWLRPKQVIPKSARDKGKQEALLPFMSQFLKLWTITSTFFFSLLLRSKSLNLANTKWGKEAGSTTWEEQNQTLWTDH